MYVRFPALSCAATTNFSLDGIHPDSHGYGIANAFIDRHNAINPAGEPSTMSIRPAHRRDR